MICPLKQSKLNKSQGLIPPAVEFFNLNKKVDSSIKKIKKRGFCVFESFTSNRKYYWKKTHEIMQKLDVHIALTIMILSNLSLLRLFVVIDTLWHKQRVNRRQVNRVTSPWRDNYLLMTNYCFVNLYCLLLKTSLIYVTYCYHYK